MCRYLLIWKQPRPQGFSLKKWVGPFFKGKALGTRLIWKRTVHRMAGSNSGRPVTTSVIDLVHSLSEYHPPQSYAHFGWSLTGA